MWSSGMEELKKLNASDAEVSQLVSLKNAGVADDMCIALVSAAHDHQHPFTSADSAAKLNRAGFTVFGAYASSIVIHAKAGIAHLRPALHAQWDV